MEYDPPRRCNWRTINADRCMIVMGQSMYVQLLMIANPFALLCCSLHFMYCIIVMLLFCIHTTFVTLLGYAS